jgi:hypothetical protein
LFDTAIRAVQEHCSRQHSALKELFMQSLEISFFRGVPRNIWQINQLEILLQATESQLETQLRVRLVRENFWFWLL